MSAAKEIGEILAIDAEARRLERERIMQLFEAIKADVYRHVPSGSDSVAVQEAFERFEEAVASA
jgi:hypothetical protein